MPFMTASKSFLKLRSFAASSFAARSDSHQVGGTVPTLRASELVPNLKRKSRSERDLPVRLLRAPDTAGGESLLRPCTYEDKDIVVPRARMTHVRLPTRACATHQTWGPPRFVGAGEAEASWRGLDDLVSASSCSRPPAPSARCYPSKWHRSSHAVWRQRSHPYSFPHPPWFARDPESWRACSGTPANL